MSEGRRPLIERFANHPLAALVNLGGNLVVVGGAVATGVIVFAGFVSNNTLVGLIFGLAISLGVSLFLWHRVRLVERRVALIGQADPGTERGPTPGEEQLSVLRTVSASIVESFERFEYDNRNGLRSAQEAARTALGTAVARAGEIRDDAAREAVFTYRDMFSQTPPGYLTPDYGPPGATASQLNALRAAQEAAVEALGNAMRGN